MRPEVLEKEEVQQLLNELFNFADGGFIRGSDRVQAFKLGRPAPKVMSFTDCDSFAFVILSDADLSVFLFVDRRCRQVHGVCVTGAWDGGSRKGGSAGRGRCTV